MLHTVPLTNALAVVVCLATAGAAGWSHGNAALAGDIDPGLEACLAATREHETVSTLVYLHDQVDIEALSQYLDGRCATLRTRHEVVVHTLQELANSTQANLLARLGELQFTGRVEEFEPLWITNCIRVDAGPAEIERLAGHPDVGTIYYNYEVDSMRPAEVGFGVASSRDVENGVAAVRAPEAWALGYTGQGVLVANIDSGVDGNHPALASRWAGVADPRYEGHPEWAWFDPYAGQNDFPYDDLGHGTHVMGSLCGGPPGDEIGVAPGALWIAAAPIQSGSLPQTITDILLSMQWMLDPDGDPTTNWDVPGLCSNSWGLHAVPPCDETFWTCIDACEAAGIVMLFSAGTDTLWSPGDRATDDYRNCAMGAVNAHEPSWPVAYFSPLGPSYCTPTGGPAIKPELMGPGVNVRSAQTGGGYIMMSGTSMPVPHVAGVVALVRQACPDLGVAEIKQVLYETAHDLGVAGEDNTYGWGMVDAYEAVMRAENLCGWLLGDLNCDGVLNAFDIDAFILALTDPYGYVALYIGCDIMRADCNGDGEVNAFDIDPFVDLLTGP